MPHFTKTLIVCAALGLFLAILVAEVGFGVFPSDLPLYTIFSSIGILLGLYFGRAVARRLGKELVDVAFTIVIVLMILAMLYVIVITEQGWTASSQRSSHYLFGLLTAAAGAVVLLHLVLDSRAVALLTLLPLGVAVFVSVFTPTASAALSVVVCLALATFAIKRSFEPRRTVDGTRLDISRP
jgi:hypothetical protein